MLISVSCMYCFDLGVGTLVERKCRCTVMGLSDNLKLRFIGTLLEHHSANSQEIRTKEFSIMK